MSTDFRPRTWDDYIGQAKLKATLQTYIDSALERDLPLEHILLSAPPGAGKTTMAQIVGTRLGEPVEVITAPVSQKSLIRLVTNHQGVLLIDEAHRFKKSDQEWLLTLLEPAEGRFGYLEDNAGRRHEAAWLTVILATTERENLIDPLVDRIPLQPQFEDYTEEEMAQIVTGMAERAGVQIDHDVSMALGRASAGTPRKAKNLVVAYRALSDSLGRTPTTEEVLDLCNTESDGLTSMHVKYMETLYALGGSKGLNVLCSLLRQPSSVVQDLERTLIDRGLVTYGDRGRELTPQGIRRVRKVRQGPVRDKRRNND